MSTLYDEWAIVFNLMSHWWFWVAYIACVFGGWYAHWRLFTRREYRETPERTGTVQEAKANGQEDKEEMKGILFQPWKAWQIILVYGIAIILLPILFPLSLVYGLIWLIWTGLSRIGEFVCDTWEELKR